MDGRQILALTVQFVLDSVAFVIMNVKGVLVSGSLFYLGKNVMFLPFAILN